MPHEFVRQVDREMSSLCALPYGHLSMDCIVWLRPRKLPEGLMNRLDELISAPQYFKNAAVTLPANAILIRSALEVGVVDRAC